MQMAPMSMGPLTHSVQVLFIIILNGSCVCLIEALNKIGFAWSDRKTLGEVLSMKTESAPLTF